jgi:hypothetical protein
MEVPPLDHGLPVRELVLSNAEIGSTGLHVHQIHTAWPAAKQADEGSQLIDIQNQVKMSQ